jgi:hypothetical protein
MTGGNHSLFSTFDVLVAAVIGFDMLRTWWKTNEWRRRARRTRATR